MSCPVRLVVLGCVRTYFMQVGKSVYSEGLCLCVRLFNCCSTNYMLNVWCVQQSPLTSYMYIDTCGKLPAMFALFAVLGPVRPYTIRPFLPSFLSLRHVRKDNSPALLYCKQWKTGRSLRARLHILHMCSSS